MKRHITHYIYLFLGTFSAVCLMACNSNKDWQNIEFYNVEKMEQLTEKPLDEGEDSTGFESLREMEEREMDVKVDMQFMKAENVSSEKVCNLINGHLVELLLKQSSDLSIDDAIAQYIEDVKSEFHGDDVANVYHDHLTGRAEYGMENVINYRLLEDVFTGGAHPCKLTTILRFDTQTGDFITLDQVFPTINQPKLQDILLAKLMKDQNAHSLEELHKKGILEMTDMFISNNFALREDSIEFYYNEYDIAPYASGACTICVSYEDVKDVISVKWENRK
ncbi:MAG: DUF3298 domain-containing protein [Bacteroidaceae bacterium]|nr:DUF3298 domain-containing protein [Bacteroidaceae bacterium]